MLYDTGILKRNYIYKYHYYVKNLINEGDCVIDIGANLGYYSRIFSRIVGENGIVVCIEPVPVFFRTLKWALNKKCNTVLLNCALGEEDRPAVIVLPNSKGVFRTGLAHIQTTRVEENNSVLLHTEMKKGSTLLKIFPKINYIKCDIEGYEEFVLPEIKEIIRKHRPILQVESNGKHKEVVCALMQELDYIEYAVYRNSLIKNFNSDIEQGDYIFIHKSMKIDPYSGKILSPDRLTRQEVHRKLVEESVM